MAIAPRKHPPFRADHVGSLLRPQPTPGRGICSPAISNGASSNHLSTSRERFGGVFRQGKLFFL